jgi:mono/diheme cytochrome c family protein
MIEAQVQIQKWMNRWKFAGVMVVTLLWAMAGMSRAQQEEVVAGGKQEYLKYCATCHGMEGKGDGPSAGMLKTKPADLTQLSKKHQGQFPFWRVYQVIDGREPVMGHGTNEMPIWGDRFRMQEAGAAAEAQVRGQILQLVYYLESIQEK